MEETKTTPMMRQWERIKAQYPDTILMFRMGDFYECFGEDAQIVARECEITLTSRDKSTNATQMCGVPYHAAERYIAQLVGKGYRCAICDQVEDPKLARGLVKREVTRVLSPGTLLEDSYLNSVGASKANNFLAALSCDKTMTHFGLALVDVSTGEFLAGEVQAAASSRQTTEESPCAPNEADSSFVHPQSSIDQTPDNADESSTRWSALREELLRFSPAEILVPQQLRECQAFWQMLQNHDLRATPFDCQGFDSSRQKLLNQFRVSSLRGFGIEELGLAQDAAALVLDYLRSTHLGALGHLRRISVLSQNEWMLLDNATRRNLELVQSLRDGSAKGTLFALLDETRTGAGARLLKKWILQPLLSKSRIENRQDAVSELLGDTLLRGDVRDLLKGIGDIERLVARAVAGQGNARDLVALRNALQTLPALQTALSSTRSRAIETVKTHLNPAPELTQLLANAIADEPPATLNDGGLIREGYDEELETTRREAREGRVWVAQLEESERLRTGIKNMKVGFNNVFGYYIEISKVNQSQVPPEYVRKQTTANAERYITEELKDKEKVILGAQDVTNAREKELFESVRKEVANCAAPLMDAARALAHLDVYAGFAEVAGRRDYARPVVTEDRVLDLRSGRHPVVEVASKEPFVPNDCVMDAETQQVLIITGPNASGKSTFLRQVALIALMAQIGSFVPAKSATIGLLDRIFTRVGAQDDLATGQSTFTVEMNETANILNNATPQSLVILDEVGRGTSTYDGLSIAWAVAEFLHERGPKTLFATHYHHLNELEERLPRAKNYRIAVKEDGDHIIFLRRIIRGGTDRSFGIQVARLAGLPESVIARARELLESFSREKLRGQDVQTNALPTAQPLSDHTSLFDAKIDGESSTRFATHPVVESLKTLDVDNLTPMEAMLKLQELRKAALSD